MGDEGIEEIKSFIQRVRGRFEPEKIILFGSRARGDNLRESDYDLIIVSKEFEKWGMHERIVKVLELQRVRADVELICLTPKEFEEQSKSITTVREALKEGIEIT